MISAQHASRFALGFAGVSDDRELETEIGEDVCAFYAGSHV